MTDGGASSESDRLRAGSEVSSLKGWRVVRAAHVCRAQCRSPQWSPYLGLAGLTRWAHNVVGVWRSDIMQVVLCILVNLQRSALHVIAMALCLWGLWKVYLGVVGGTRAIAVDWRGVDSRRVGTWGRNEVVGLSSRRSLRIHQHVLYRQSTWGRGKWHLFEKTWLKLAGELGESV